MSARESADAAKDGGELVTTLLLGFPQGVVTALFRVALPAWKHLPGPEIVKKNPEVIYSVVWLQGISGIIGTLIGFGLAPKLGEVRYTFMVLIMFTFSFFSTRGSGGLFEYLPKTRLPPGIFFG